MDIRDVSSQFSVYVFTTNVDTGASVKVSLSSAGYDAYYFQDPESLENALRDNPPHLLVFSTSAFVGNLSEFVDYVLEINEDIKFIALGKSDQFAILSQYNEYGFVDVLDEDLSAVDLRVVWAVDRAAEKMYLTFQNEQLYSDLKSTEEKFSEQNALVAANQQSLQALEVEKKKLLVEANAIEDNLSLKINAYRSASSKEELVQNFLNNIGSKVCVFFKYLPSVRSFVATHANGVPSHEIQGVGVQLDSESAKELAAQITTGLLPKNFSLMLKEAFQFNPPKILPVYMATQLEGIFVYAGQMSEVESRKMTEEFSLFSLCYSHFYLEKKVDTLEVTDFVTEVYNRNFYLKSIFDEVSRSRRQRIPVSVVKISMDEFYEIESSLGESVRDELLKSIATITHKSSRSNDLTCRTGMNEFAMILPNCNKKGAALRAERLRRIIEGTTFLDNGFKVSISLGVSEYPSLSDSEKTLDETATKALQHIADKGGNKICMYRAADSFKPEFDVPVE